MRFNRVFFLLCMLLVAELSFAQAVKQPVKSTTTQSAKQPVKTQPVKSTTTQTAKQPVKTQPVKSTTTQTAKQPVKTQPVKSTTTQTAKQPVKTQPTRPTTNAGNKKPAAKPRVTTLDEKKYRGMADMGFSWGIGNGKEFNRFGISTIHGYQVVPIYLFIGGGIEVDYYSGGNGFSVPLFLDLRTNFKAKVSPFIDARVGGSPFDLKGFYVSPSFGIRIPVKQTQYGISLMAGYTLQTADLGFYYYSKDVTTVDKKKMGGIHFKVGFEW